MIYRYREFYGVAASCGDPVFRKQTANLRSRNGR